MNDDNTPQDELAPLDDFEQHWIDKLAEREPDLVRSEDAFVQSVLDRQAQSQAAPAVIGRIGAALLPYAAAAAIMVAAVVGWYVLTDQGNTTDEQPFVDQPQPGGAVAVVTPERPKVALGKLIANAQNTMANPATNLTETVREAPDTLSVDNLLDFLSQPVPDLNDILAPLAPKDEQQSRA